eukprot:g3974.t1
MLYKNFGKRANDCGDVCSARERTVKLSSKTSDGTKFEMTQMHRVGKEEEDKGYHPGVFTEFVTKFGKRKGFNIDEFSVKRDLFAYESGLRPSATGAMKYSLSGVVPDAKLKGSVGADMLTGNFNKAAVGVEYSKGPLGATCTFTSKLSGRDVGVKADAVFAKGPCAAGVSFVTTVPTKKPSFDVAFQYSMGKDTTFLLQTQKGLKVHNASVHRQVSSNLELAAFLSHCEKSDKAEEDTLARTCGTYNIDGTSSVAVDLDLGSVKNPKGQNMTLAATYTNQIRSYAALNLSARVPLGGTYKPKFGWNVEVC